jgi:predicted Zn-dependent protease
MPKSTAPAPDFRETTTMKDLLGIPEAALDQIMAIAYQFYASGHYQRATTLCRGLIAADHQYWWSYSLYAAVLRRLGRLQEALEQIDLGLAYEPGESKLLLMRGEILGRSGMLPPDPRSPEGGPWFYAGGADDPGVRRRGCGR